MQIWEDMILTSVKKFDAKSVAGSEKEKEEESNLSCIKNIVQGVKPTPKGISATAQKHSAIKQGHDSPAMKKSPLTKNIKQRNPKI